MKDEERGKDERWLEDDEKKKGRKKRYEKKKILPKSD